MILKGMHEMEKDHDVEYKKILRAIYKWNVTKHKAIPPKSELPECIKERVRWILKAHHEFPITFIGSLIFAFPDPDCEEELKKDFEFGGDTWFPISQQYKEYWKEYYSYRVLIEQEVAIAIIYGLNDEPERKIKNEN